MIELKDIKTEKLMEELASRAGSSIAEAYILIAFCKKVVEVYDNYYKKNGGKNETPPEIILN